MARGRGVCIRILSGDGERRGHWAYGRLVDLGFVMVERDCGGEGDELSGTRFVMGNRIFVRVLFGAGCRSRDSGFVGGGLSVCLSVSVQRR